MTPSWREYKFTLQLHLQISSLSNGDVLGHVNLRHVRSSANSILHRHLSWHSIDTPMTLHWHSINIWQLVESQLIFNHFIWISWNSANYQLTVDQVSIKCQPSMYRDLNWNYRSRVSIDTWLWMLLVHMIRHVRVLCRRLAYIAVVIIPMRDLQFYLVYPKRVILKKQSSSYSTAKMCQASKNFPAENTKNWTK